MELSQEEKYAQALKRVKARKSFYINIVNYLIINVLLFVINYITDPGHWWFYWVTIGWGVGLAFHAFSVFGVSERFGDDWEKKKVQEMMDKENQK